MKTDAPAELEALRERIDAIDERIVRLLADRRKVVEDVVALKKARNMAVYHPAREEDLISRRRQQARASGLDPDFVEELYRAILRGSRVCQTRTMALKGLRPGAVALMVGGRGAMGRYFARCFSEAGYVARVLDRDDWPNVAKLCRGVDLAIIGVPIDQTAAVAQALGPHLPETAVLADITSIKARPLAAMMAAHPGPVLGLHPLFGPTPSSLDKQIIAATPGRHPDACAWVLDQFAAWGAVIVTASAEEHDTVMDIVQALRHFATFAFGSFLAGRRVDLARTLEFSSPIYRLELGMVGRLFAQDPGLYREIIFASPERRELLRDYARAMSENLSMVETGDKARFQAEFEKVAEWFGPFSDQAMRESTYIIDKLIERF